MNNLERLLSISEKRLKEAQEEIHSLQSLRKYEQLLQTLNQEKVSLQQKLDQQQREIAFLEQDRDNLLVALREQSEFIISMSDLSHNPALKKYHVIQQLESMRQEWEKATKQVSILQGEVRKLSVENGQLMGEVSNLSLKLKHDQTLQKQHLEFELKQRDQLIEELVEKLRQFNMDQQKMEAESISESESISASQNDTQIQINIQNDCHIQFEQQILLKEQQIVDLQQQLLELQQKQHQPQQIIDQQQLMQAIPQIVRNKVAQLQYLQQQLLPQLCTKIGNLENNHNQFKSLLKDNQQLREQNKELQDNMEIIKQDKNEAQDDLDYTYKSIQIILKQNQNLIQVLMNNNYNKDSIMEILKVDNPIYMENTPFDSIEDLVNGYLSLRRQLNRISRQCQK